MKVTTKDVDREMYTELGRLGERLHKMRRDVNVQGFWILGILLALIIEGVAIVATM